MIEKMQIGGTTRWSFLTTRLTTLQMQRSTWWKGNESQSFSQVRTPTMLLPLNFCLLHSSQETSTQGMFLREKGKFLTTQSGSIRFQVCKLFEIRLFAHFSTSSAPMHWLLKCNQRQQRMMDFNTHLNLHQPPDDIEFDKIWLRSTLVLVSRAFAGLC